MTPSVFLNRRWCEKKSLFGKKQALKAVYIPVSEYIKWYILIQNQFNEYNLKRVQSKCCKADLQVFYYE